MYPLKRNSNFTVGETLVDNTFMVNFNMTHNGTHGYNVSPDKMHWEGFNITLSYSCQKSIT